jgi:hypothetical protein
MRVSSHVGLQGAWDMRAGGMVFSTYMVYFSVLLAVASRQPRIHATAA